MFGLGVGGGAQHALHEREVRPLVLQHLLGERAQVAGQPAAVERLRVERRLGVLDHQQQVEHAHVLLGRLRGGDDRRHARHDDPGACAAPEQFRSRDARDWTRHCIANHDRAGARPSYPDDQSRRRG
jgi:hypothetical protein